MKKIPLSTFICLILSLGELLVGTSTHADSLTTIQQATDVSRNRIASMQAHISYETLQSGVASNPVEADWVFKGNKSDYVMHQLAVKTNDKGNAALIDLTEFYYDGAYNHLISFNRFSGEVYKTSSREKSTISNGMWTPIQFAYALTTSWLNDALKTPDCHLVGNATDPQAGPVTVIRIPLTGSMTEATVSLAPKYGYAIIKAIMTGPSNLYNTYEAHDFRLVNGVWVPTSAIMANGPKGLFKMSFRFSNIKVNTVDDAQLSENKIFPEGSRLWDSAEQNKYRRTGGHWVLEPRGGSVGKSTKVSQRDMNIPGILFGISFASALCFGVILWRRQKGS